MDIKLLKPGTKVTIDLECKLTRDGYGLNVDMENMTGTVQTIGSINHFSNCVRINGFNWATEDLTILERPIKIKKQPTTRFDVKDLVL